MVPDSGSAAKDFQQVKAMATNSQIETVNTGADKAKLAAAALLLLGGIVAFYSLGRLDLWIRVVALLVLIALAVLAVRLGRLGRILVAVRASPDAAGTLGIDIRWLRVSLFAGSAGIAGLAGALFAGLRGTIVAFDFQFFASLLLLLMAVVWGVTSVTGAALGGIFLMYLPVAQSDSPSIAGLLFLLLGVGAVILARDPNGLANKVFHAPGWIRDTAIPAISNRLPDMALRLPRRRSSAYDEFEQSDDLSVSDEEVDADAVASR